MNVKQLKEAIQNLPDEMEVILQKDSEGNGYSPLSDADSDCVYFADSTYSGEVYSTKHTADECCMSADEYAEMLAQPRALVLSPVD